MLCSSIFRIRSRKRCKRFFETLLKQPAKIFFVGCSFLLRKGDGETGSVVKMLSKPQMGAKLSPFKRTQSTKKARFLGLFWWYE